MELVASALFVDGGYVYVSVWVKGISISEEMFGMDLTTYSFPNCAELTNTPFI